MEYYQIIADRIAALCKERGISINKLASMGNVKQSTIDNIMNCASKNPGVQTQHKNAIAFNMTVSEFIYFPTLN